MGVGASSQYFDTRGGGHNSNNAAAAAAAFTKAEKSGNSHVNSSNNNEDDYKQSLLPSEIKKNMACEKRRETTKTDDGEGNRTKASSRTAHIIASAPLTKTILDEPTLKIVGNYLKSGNYNARSTLEEEDVALYAYRSTQYTNERTRYRQDISDDEEFYNRVYGEEENYAFANEFFKHTVNESQDLAGGPRIQMHNKTVNWVKKAAGLQRPYDPLEHQQSLNLSDSDEGETVEPKASPRRRLTRGMARNTRVKRRQERIRKETEGINALAAAVQEIEEERGESFPSSKRFVAMSSDEESSDESSNDDNTRSNSSIEIPSNDPLPPPGRTLVAVLPFDSEKTRTRLQMKGEEIKITRVLVQEGHVSGVTEEEILEWKRGRKRRRNREYYLQKKDEKLKAKARSRRRREKKEAKGNEANKRKRVSAINDNSSEEIDGNEENSVVQERKLFGRLHPEGLIRRDEPRDPISLSMIQWQRWSEGETQSDTNVLPIRSKILPPLLVEAGLEYQPRTKNITERSSFFEGDRLRNLSDKMYASSSMKVINALGGKARNWAFHEFFYSDIDRAWYNMNEFASDVSKLGIPPSAKLTKSEWSMVRRRIRHRPRRFSKNFIIAQLGKRNLYRSIVRQVQRNPGSSHRLGFDVPASIRPGTKVTAYNKRCGVLNRGTVLFHDPAKKGYVIQFERKELGHEFCPDTEVATLCHVEWSPVESSLFPDRVSLPFGTSISIDSRINSNDSLLEAKRCDKEAERHTLISTMAIVETATKRKKMILEALDMCNALAESEDPKSLRAIRANQPWLLANLEKTNRALDSALVHMQIMYGDGYSKFKKKWNPTCYAIHRDNDEPPEWADDLCSEMTGNYIAQSLQQLQGDQTHGSRLSNCASFLLTTAYSCEAASGSTSVLSPAVVEKVLRTGLKKYGKIASASYSNTEEAACMEDALSELEEALNLLRTEILVSNCWLKSN